MVESYDEHLSFLFAPWKGGRRVHVMNKPRIQRGESQTLICSFHTKCGSINAKQKNSWTDRATNSAMSIQRDRSNQHHMRRSQMVLVVVSNYYKTKYVTSRSTRIARGTFSSNLSYPERLAVDLASSGSATTFDDCLRR